MEFNGRRTKNFSGKTHLFGNMVREYFIPESKWNESAFLDHIHDRLKRYCRGGDKGILRPTRITIEHNGKHYTISSITLDDVSSNRIKLATTIVEDSVATIWWNFYSTHIEFGGKTYIDAVRHDDYAPKLTAGFSENLVGDGSSTEEEFSFRPTAGENRNVKNDCAARIVKIKGNSLVENGEIINGNYGSIKTTGRNLWDEQWEVGGLSSGNPTQSTNMIRSKNYTRVLPSTKYYATIDNPQQESVYYLIATFYDSDHNYIKDLAVNNTIFTTPANAAYLKFTTNSSTYIYGPTYQNNICLSLYWEEYAHLNGTYQPYTEFVRDLSWIKKYFPNGMRSAVSARDEIRFNSSTQKWEAVQRIGEIDLGNLTWSTDTVGDKVGFVCRQSVVIPPADLYTKCNMICAPFKTVAQSGNGSYQNNNVIFANPNGWLLVSSWEHNGDVASFQDSMQGVTLYHELSTPIVTEIEETPNMDYNTSDYGVEELLSDTKSAPIVADIVYEPNALNAIKNIPDLLANKLVLSVKQNGNIVLTDSSGISNELMPATPSGHPLHDAFTAAGGVWTPYENLPERLKDERSLANGGYWSYRVSEGGLEDITTEEFVKAYAFDPILSQRVPPLAMHSAISLMRTESGFITVQPRFNINRSRSSAAADYNGALNGSPTKSQNVMEVAWLSLTYSATATSIAYLCKNNSNLKRLNCNPLEISRCTATTTTTDAFVGCESLEFLHLQKIPKSINLGTLKSLANESVLYMVNNVLPTATEVVLTLHPDAYARAIADPEIEAALEAHTNIKLASA